jgi:hypothetical protein
MMESGLGGESSAKTDWMGLYRLGGIAGLIAGPLTIIDIIVFVVWPQPSTVEGWFALFQRSWILGLLDMDLLGMTIYVIIVPLVLALYLTLRRTGQSATLVAGVITFIGMAAYFASNTGISMLYLSGQYEAATTDAQRAAALAAGQAVTAIFLGQAFTVSFLLVSAALLITSIVMLRSDAFSRRTAYIGVVANLCGLGEFAPVPFLIMMATGVVNAVALGIWLILAGRRLWQLGQNGHKVEAKLQRRFSLHMRAGRAPPRR